MPVDTNIQYSEYLTETQGTRLNYNPKRTDSSDVSIRVLVISPYQQLNAYLETEIPKRFPKTSVDIICHSDNDTPPYINVDLIEKNKRIPNWIIDFQRIISRIPSRQYVQETASLIMADLIEKNFSELQTMFRPENWSTVIADKIEKEIKDIKNKLFSALEKVSYNKTVTGVVGFREYGAWRNGKNIVYISPTEQFVKSLDELHVYDEQGNFCSDQVPIKPFQPQVLNNLELIINQKTEQTPLLFEWIH